MKVSTIDLLRIMRLFDLADETNVPKEISQLAVTHPEATSTLATYIYSGKAYAVLFDDIVQDDVALLTTEIKKIHHNAEITLVRNPRTDNNAHGMPYQGKTCYLATLNDHLTRLDSYLAKHNPEFSRSSWQEFIKQGYVNVNGKTAEKPKQLIRPVDIVTTDLPSKPGHSNESLPVIYKDDDIVVIDKPAGVLTHAKNERDDEFTVESFASRYIDSTLGLDERHGIVHRLDRDTSGIIACARNKTAYEHLKAQFAGRLVNKTYYAITDGVPSQTEAIIDVPLMRSLTTPGTFVADLKGKSAETRYEIVDRNREKALVLLQPKTGRTHQLRVHLAHIGTPIVGDRLYGINKNPTSRMYLHAATLQFSGQNGKDYQFESSVPKEFDQELHQNG